MKLGAGTAGTAPLLLQLMLLSAPVTFVHRWPTRHLPKQATVPSSTRPQAKLEPVTT